jgi:hypothetical protein
MYLLLRSISLVAVVSFAAQDRIEAVHNANHHQAQKATQNDGGTNRS